MQVSMFYDNTPWDVVDVTRMIIATKKAHPLAETKPPAKRSRARVAGVSQPSTPTASSAPSTPKVTTCGDYNQGTCTRKACKFVHGCNWPPCQATTAHTRKQCPLAPKPAK